MDLPVWQALHEELSPLGLDIVTVALDPNGEGAREPSEPASPTHPSLVDPSFRLVELLGITNVPFGMWIDETGTIRRPDGSAPIPRDPAAGNPAAAAMANMPEAQRATVAAMA